MTGIREHPVRDIEDFINGFKEFRDTFWEGQDPLYRELARGQHPNALVIACCDSRVDPALLTGSRPGDLFVVRNVANLVPPFAPDAGLHGVSAALEFGVLSLEVRNIIILGHSGCGGIRALMEDRGDTGHFVGRWMSIAHGARDSVRARLGHHPLEKQCAACERAGILLSLENLTGFPFVRQRLDAGLLSLHGWYFDMRAGELSSYDARSGRFLPLVNHDVCAAHDFDGAPGGHATFPAPPEPQ